MAVAIAEFREVCLDQGVAFVPDAAERLEQKPLAGIRDMVPLIAGLLRTEVHPLANKPIEGNMWEDDTAAAALQAIVNASIVPVEDGPLSFRSHDAQGDIYSCDSADANFTKIMCNLLATDQEGSRGSADRFEGFGFEVFTLDHVPVFLRKSIGEKSALSLARTAINGIPYPAGSIMRIDTDADIARGKFDVNRDAAIEIDIADIEQIRFIRLGTYAFRPYERLAVVEQQDFQKPLDDQQLEQLLMGSLSSVQEAAARAAKPAPPQRIRRRVLSPSRPTSVYLRNT